MRVLAVAGAGALLTVLATVNGAAAAPGDVLDLELDDAAGSTVAADSSGLGHVGTIGDHVVMNGSYARFDRHAPGEGIAYGFAHLISIPDAADGTLDPGAGNFSVEIRYRTKENFGNLLQKGQATTKGGQVKFQQPKGKLSCMFKTPQGTATAGSGTTPLNDNLWHTVRCDRTPSSVTMYVDGVRTGRSVKPTGLLDNSRPWTIGGKSECDAVEVTCDYFAGDVDYVRLIPGSGVAPDTTPPAVTSTTPADGAVGALRGANVTATFDEAVTGVDGTSMTIEKTSTGAQYHASVSYDPTSKKAILNPDVTLPSNTEYTVRLSDTIADAAGNRLPSTSWSFNTSS